jgi:hypothetical protein
MGSGRRHLVRCRPQSTWWEGRRPVRDAEVRRLKSGLPDEVRGCSSAGGEDGSAAVRTVGLVLHVAPTC